MLDLMQIADQIGEAGRREGERRVRAVAETQHAATLMRAFDADAWAVQVSRIRAANTAWQMAHCEELPAGAFGLGSLPEKYVVVAADGSQVAPDRHDGVGGCYLLNASRIFLTYGTGARARLETVPVVLTQEGGDESDGDGRAEAQVAMGRYAHEMRTIAALVCEAGATGLPAVALTDGSLIAWHLYDKERQDPLKREALDALLAALEQARSCRVPIVGYVSDPGACDIVSALRVTLCPADKVACTRCGPRSEETERPCRAVSRATDSTLFQELLGEGERSPVFTSRQQATGFSKVLDRYHDDDRIDFFYLNVGAEIARIEIPAWVAADSDMVDRVHAICFDQAVKGRGYPVALAEAHERAVVRGADREAFLNQLRRSFVQSGLRVNVTRKALAKRTRAV